MSSTALKIRTVYLKVTNRCNVGCDFCYLPESTRLDKSVMSLLVAKDVARSIAVANHVEGYGLINLIVHGGEPLSMSGEGLSKIVREFVEESKEKVLVSIQTSLLPLSDRHLDFVHQWCDGWIGSSLDLTQRKINNSKEAYDELWEKKLDFASENGCKVRPIIVPSVSEAGCIDEFLDYLIGHGLYGFDIDRYTNYGGTDNQSMPTNLEHSNYLLELTSCLFERFESGLKIGNNVVEAALRGVFYSIPGERWGGSCQKSFLVIEPSGDFNTCPDRASREQPYGSAKEAGSILSAPERLKWIDHQEFGHKTGDCFKCQYQEWCRSGCPIVENVDASGECSGYKTYLDYLKSLDPILVSKYLSAKEGRYAYA